MTEDWENSDEWKRWADYVVAEVIPAMDASALGVSLVPGKPENRTDVKFCVELGMMIMMDKPIIAVIAPGTKVPDKLVAVADEIVEGDINDPNFQDRMTAAVNRVTARLDNESTDD